MTTGLSANMFHLRVTQPVLSSLRRDRRREEDEELWRDENEDISFETSDPPALPPPDAAAGALPRHLSAEPPRLLEQARDAATTMAPATGTEAGALGTKP